MDEKTMCIIALILACIFVLGYLLYQIKKNGLRATVIQLIVYAEKTLGSGQGKAKMDYVIDKLISILPIPVRFFITREEVQDFAQHIFDEIKEALDYREDIANGQENVK